MASIWGGDSPSVAWNENSWASNTITITLSGQSATTSVGTLDAYLAQGWGREDYGNLGWGVDYSVSLTAPSGLTATVGEAGVQFLVPLTAPSG